GPAAPATPARPVPAGPALVVGSGGYPTVNEAIEAAKAGATIRIKAGTYAEEVTIDKPVTLVPYGDGDVWIDAGCQRDHALVVHAAQVTIQGLKAKKSIQGAVLIEDASANHVTVDGMTIQDFDCQNGTDAYKAGIAVWYAGPGQRLTNNTITYRVELPQIAGHGQRGEGDGIWFKSTTKEPSGGGHYIAGNVITGGSDGIGGETESDIHGSFDRDTVIEHNTVRDCNDDGIQIEGGDVNVRVQDNQISGCGLGIAFAPNLVGPLYVERNTIHGDTPGDYGNGNLACFKVGRAGKGTAYLTGNTCEIATGGDGISQTNGGLSPLVLRDNTFRVSRYIYEFGDVPPAGSSFDGDCLSTSDPERFIKWGGKRYDDLPTFQADTKQEPKGHPCQ
ncbi:MAG TPA: right-handed parallel beta-helix repeat-containing protein, partial [Thermomicrobiales bacterium]|nr:right-handed parallel beta-helix repeat-containing protein [Thermomicrobiales bacterium]